MTCTCRQVSQEALALLGLLVSQAPAGCRSSRICLLLLVPLAQAFLPIIIAACLLAPPPARLPACPGRCMQGFLQFAPKSAVGKLMGAAAAGAAAEYSSPRPTPKGGPATTAVPRIIANSSITFRPHHA